MYNILLPLLLLVLSIATGCSDFTVNYQEAEKYYNPGDIISKSIIATVPCKIPAADIIIAFDSTSSMVEEKNWLINNFESFIGSISGFVADPQFAVVSFRDYPFSPYGNSTDWSYRLEQDITDSLTDILAAIQSIEVSGGDDTPESYTRVMYEAYADTNISYRGNTRRILIIIGDAIPHDNNIYEGVPGLTTVRNTAVDPGRDGVVNTADDIDLQFVLSGLTASDITLLMLLCTPPSGYSATLHEQDRQCWNYWCSLTGGESIRIASAQEMLTGINTLMENISVKFDEIKLNVEPSLYAGWLTLFAPSSYTDQYIEQDTKYTFNYMITVPEDACSGSSQVHEFKVSVTGDGEVFTEDNISIFVKCK